MPPRPFTYKDIDAVLCFEQCVPRCYWNMALQWNNRLPANHCLILNIKLIASSYMLTIDQIFFKMLFARHPAFKELNLYWSWRQVKTLSNNIYTSVETNNVICNYSDNHTHRVRILLQVRQKYCLIKKMLRSVSNIAQPFTFLFEST